MEPQKKFIPLHDLDVYHSARKLSSMAWIVYQRLSFQEKKVWGDQMLSAVDSVGANIAEDMPGSIIWRNVGFITSQELPYLKELNIGLIWGLKEE